MPDEGYEVYDWYINGVSQGSKAASLAHVLLNESTTVEVQFAIKQNSLIFGAAGDVQGGSLVCDDGELTSGSVVLANALFTFTATAREGYHFKEWRYTEQGRGTVYHDQDSGKTESSFELLMPARSCSLYAVFERDFYTLDYTDNSGNNGLTAWYMGSASTEENASLEKIYLESGELVKGGAVVTIEPKKGCSLNTEYSYVSTGSQGNADYAAGTYVVCVEQNTHVSGWTQRENYTLTLEIADTADAESPDAAVQAGRSYYYEYTEGGTTTAYYFTAPVDGTAEWIGAQVTVYASGALYSIAELDEDTRLTAHIVEKPVHTVELLSTIDGATTKGYYSYESQLPEGAQAIAETAGDEGITAATVALHHGDTLTVQLIPAQKWTASYWQVQPESRETPWEYKASSLRYSIPNICESQIGLTLSPESGYLASVSAGSDFKFMLSGSLLDMVEAVYANGNQFTSEGNTAENGSTYSWEKDAAGPAAGFGH